MGGPDILIVGAGPAGAIAGLVAARAGARVRILERSAFPREKLCGDTVNPGALAILRRLGVVAAIEARGLPVEGMVLTGANGAAVVGRYPDGLYGRAIVRRALDAALLDAALAAGCHVEYGVAVRRAMIAEDRTARGGQRVVGVVGAAPGQPGREHRFDAPVIIAADGRRSALSFGLGLARHPPRPRRWAAGAYFTGVEPPLETGDWRFGEMHVRRRSYIGVAPVPGGLTNVCVVREVEMGGGAFRDVSALIRRSLAEDSLLRARFADASMATQPVVLGPLAVDAGSSTIDGLFLAGDAAGFIDPMTGDGLRFAIRGGELAADAALRVLAGGWTGAHAAHARARIEAFASKWRFNRAVRALVASPLALGAAAAGARVAPGVVRAVIARAGDCDLAA